MVQVISVIKQNVKIHKKVCMNLTLVYYSVHTVKCVDLQTSALTKNALKGTAYVCVVKYVAQRGIDDRVI